MYGRLSSCLHPRKAVVVPTHPTSTHPTSTHPTSTHDRKATAPETRTPDSFQDKLLLPTEISSNFTPRKINQTPAESIADAISHSLPGKRKTIEQDEELGFTDADRFKTPGKPQPPQTDDPLYSADTHVTEIHMGSPKSMEGFTSKVPQWTHADDKKPPEICVEDFESENESMKRALEALIPKFESVNDKSVSAQELSALARQRTARVDAIHTMLQQLEVDMPGGGKSRVSAKELTMLAREALLRDRGRDICVAFQRNVLLGAGTSSLLIALVPSPGMLFYILMPVGIYGITSEFSAVALNLTKGDYYSTMKFIAKVDGKSEEVTTELRHRRAAGCGTGWVKKLAFVPSGCGYGVIDALNLTGKITDKTMQWLRFGNNFLFSPVAGMINRAAAEVGPLTPNFLDPDNPEKTARKLAHLRQNRCDAITGFVQLQGKVLLGAVRKLCISPGSLMSLKSMSARAVYGLASVVPRNVQMGRMPKLAGRFFSLTVSTMRGTITNKSNEYARKPKLEDVLPPDNVDGGVEVVALVSTPTQAPFTIGSDPEAESLVAVVESREASLETKKNLTTTDPDDVHGGLIPDRSPAPPETPESPDAPHT